MVTARIMWLRHLKEILRSRSPKLLENVRVLQLGAGGVGTWFAIMFAMHADPETTSITIVDDDVLEEVNANRLPYPYNWFTEGMRKVDALRNFIAAIRPGLDVRTLPVRPRLAAEIEGLARSSNANIIVDAVDNVESIAVIKKARERLLNTVALLSLHYDGTHYTIEYVPPGKTSASWDVDFQAGQYTTPSTAMTPAAIAVTAIAILMNPPEEPVIITGDLSA